MYNYGLAKFDLLRIYFNHDSYSALNIDA